MKGGYRRLQGFTRGFRGLQVVTRDDRELRRIAEGYRALLGDTRVKG